MSLVEIEKVEKTMIVTLNDPLRRNILSQGLCGALTEAVLSAAHDPEVHFVIITGHGTAFCAGADLKDLQAASDGRVDGLENVYRAFLSVADLPIPTLAAVNGAAVGAGMNLALACDLRIVSEPAFFESRFLQIGLHPGGGHAWMLLRAIGWEKAMHLLMLGQRMTAAEAVGAGLALRSVPDEDILEYPLELGRRLSVIPRDLIMRAKASMRLAANADHQTSNLHEMHEQVWSLTQEFFRQRITDLQDSIGGRKGSRP